MKKATEKRRQQLLDKPDTIADREAKELDKARMQLVRKSNKLIRQFRAEMDTAQYKITLYLISKAYTADNDLEFTFDIQEFCKVCGLDYESGKHYRRIKQDIKDLASKSQWVEVFNDTSTEVLVSLINKAWLNPQSGKIKIRLDEDIKPYILYLREQYENKGELYTQFALLYTLPMKSLYSIRLYELLKSWETAHSEDKGHYWRIDELQALLGSNYDLYAAFRRKVIEKAITEINKYSDLIIDYEPIKEGRSYKYILFRIRTKTQAEQLETRLNNSRQLDDIQLSFDDIAQMQAEQEQGEPERSPIPRQYKHIDDILRRAGLDDE